MKYFVFLSFLFSTTILHSLTIDSGWVNLLEGNNLNQFYSFVGKGAKPYPLTIKGTRYEDPTQDPLSAFVLENNEIKHTPDLTDGQNLVLGYIATKKEFSRYHFKVDYKFDTSINCDLNFECRNAGIMYHFSTDNTNHVWPVGIESNMYFDYPGSIGPLSGVTMGGPDNGNGKYRNKSSLAPVGQWNTMELFVYASDSVIHWINRQNYQSDNAASTARAKLKATNIGLNNTPLTSGHVALQIEAAAISYKNIYIRHLDSLKYLGCTDSSATNYESEATHDDGSCQGEQANISFKEKDFSITVQNNYFHVLTTQPHTVSIHSLDGKTIQTWKGQKTSTYELLNVHSGMYLLFTKVNNKTHSQKIYINHP